MPRSNVSVIVVALLAVCAACGVSHAVIYNLNAEGTGDFPTIQAAVDSADAGDSISLANGTYTGDGNRDIVVPRKDITIYSASFNPALCIVDCEGSAREEHRGFHFVEGTGTWAQLMGVGIVNGYVSEHGGGIWDEGCSANIQWCNMSSCTAGGRGGGVYASDGAVCGLMNCLVWGNSAADGGGIAYYYAIGTVMSTEVYENTASDIGGGFYCQVGGAMNILQCDVHDNTAVRAGGIRMGGSGGPAITQTLVYRNEAIAQYAGGVWFQAGTLQQSTIVDNDAATTGGGVYSHGGTGTIDRCIIAFNGTGEGVAATEGNAPTLTCCDVYGNPDGNYDTVVGDQTGLSNNFSEDPEFCGFDIADYRLYDTSPCLPGGRSPCGELVGALDQGCDSPVEESSWGRVKALYR